MRFISVRPNVPDAYDEAKAAQIAAFFALRRGGAIEVLTLAKLMYLAERASYERYGAPLTGDKLCSMKHGPVLSETLNYIRGEGEPPAIWREYFGPREGNHLYLWRPTTEDSLLRLSEADLELLNGVWREFGDMSPHDLWVFTHKLPEYEDPGESSRPVKMEILLQDAGYSADDTKEVLEQIEERKRYSAALKRAIV